MKKSQIIQALQDENPWLTTEDIDRIFTVMFDEIAEALAAGERVELRRFGTFTVRNRPRRKMRNPYTGGSVMVPAKNVPHFKPSRQVNNRINQSRDMADRQF